MLFRSKLANVKGAEVINDAFFNEFTLRLKRPAAEVVDRLAGKGVLAGVPAGRLWPDRPETHDLLIVAATETNTAAEMDTYARALAEVL